MTRFEEGYSFYVQQAGTQLAGYEATSYVNRVNSEIDKLVSDLNAFKGFSTAPNILKGDIAEFWHSDTFNINAVANNSTNRAYVDRSHDFASADITSNFGEKFGLKYYKDAVSSAQQQSKSVFERFSEYKAQGGKDSLEKFLQDRGFTDNSVLNDPIYSGQVRIIPKEQLKDACDWLKRKIETESVNRPEQVNRYQETLDMLSDRIRDGEGTESVALSDSDAKALAALAKEGNVTAEELAKLGISAEEIIKFEHIAQQAFKAGLSAAAISIVLKVAPEIYKAIDYLIKTGELDAEQFKRIGFAAIQGGSEGFIRGSVAAALTASCEAGLLGEACKNVAPEAIGMAVVLTMNTMKNALLVATGKMSRTELANQLIKELFISTISYSLGVATQTIIEIPVLGFMIGSFVGSIAGAFVYDISYNVLLSFCADTGFTMFGLVEQDYTMPKEVFEELGLDTLELDTLELDTLELDTLELDTLELDSLELDKLDIVFLRRGVIGVSKIGYTL